MIAPTFNVAGVLTRPSSDGPLHQQNTAITAIGHVDDASVVNVDKTAGVERACGGSRDSISTAVKLQLLLIALRTHMCFRRELQASYGSIGRSNIRARTKRTGMEP